MGDGILLLSSVWFIWISCGDLHESVCCGALNWWQQCVGESKTAVRCEEWHLGREKRGAQLLQSPQGEISSCSGHKREENKEKKKKGAMRWERKSLQDLYRKLRPAIKVSLQVMGCYFLDCQKSTPLIFSSSITAKICLSNFDHFVVKWAFEL